MLFCRYHVQYRCVWMSRLSLSLFTLPKGEKCSSNQTLWTSKSKGQSGLPITTEAPPAVTLIDLIIIIIIILGYVTHLHNT